MRPHAHKLGRPITLYGRDPYDFSKSSPSQGCSVCGKPALYMVLNNGYCKEHQKTANEQQAIVARVFVNKTPVRKHSRRWLPVVAK